MYIGLSSDEKYRLHAKLEHIPKHVQEAVLLYEDRYFYQHFGVNIFSLFRSVKSVFSGARRVGASTIAMQVARLRYKLVTNTFLGKLHQMLLASQLIYHYGHETIFEAYFSLAPYGGNIEGIEAASQIYFHQSAQTLTHMQALALCLIPQNPQARAFRTRSLNGQLTYNADFEKSRNALHKRWNEHYPDQNVSAKAPPLRVYSQKELPFIAPHLSLELLQKIRSNSENAYKQHSILSTIDKPNQIFLEEKIRQFVEDNTLYNLTNASAMLLHWESMEVRALVGSADFFNVNIDGQVDGTKARRSPGSTLKPFIYALALEQGLIHPQTMLMDAPKSFAEYNPENFDKQFQGPLSAREALQLSRNIPAIELASRLDPSLYTFLQRAHVGFKHQADHYGLSLVLGGAELRMRDLVALYAMLVNNGIWQDLRFVKNENIKNERDPFFLLSPESALATLYMLEKSADSFSFQKQKIPLRYKTGTSNGFRDAWAIGVIGPYVLAVWVGNFDNTSNRMLIGSTVAAPLYKSIANTLAWQENLQDTIAEKYKDTKLVELEVCRDTGDVQTELCPETVPTWFIPGRSPITNSNVYRKIWLDSKTGLRLCTPNDNAKELIWEFWPTEVYQLFAEAGIYKPLPPPLAEPCDNIQNINTNAINIQSPKQGIVYHISNHADNMLSFIASSSSDAKTLFWFINEEYVGSSKPNSSFLLPVKVGKHKVQVLDDLGQSNSMTLLVEL